MKFIWILAVCFVLSAPGWAQTSSDDEAASRDDVILYLQTMHTHDLMQRIMQAQANSMRALYRQTIAKDGKAPSDSDQKFSRWMDDLMKNMPVDEITNAMIPAYQKHFTKGDLEAMTAFYSSPVGQKVLQELPDVMQEGNQAAMPIMTKYLNEWTERMKKDIGSEPKAAPNSSTPSAAPES